MATNGVPPEEKEKTDGAPPYISQSTFITFLDWIKGIPITPTEIDRSLWESKFAGSTGTQLMQGLRFLKLLDGKRPTPRLDELARADNEQRKGLIEQVLRDAYGNNVIEALRVDTPRMFDQRLTELGATSATHRKAASFLINIAKIAGLEIQPAISKRARIRRGAGTGKRSKASPVDSQNPEPAGEPEAKVFELHPSLQALLEDLERIGPSWHEVDKGRWLETFQVVLNYSYPVHEEAAPRNGTQQLPLTQPVE